MNESRNDEGKKKKGRRFLRAVGLILAFVIGIPLWLIMGAWMYDPPSPLFYFVLLSPIVGAAFPRFVTRLRAQRVVAAAWEMAFFIAYPFCSILVINAITELFDSFPWETVRVVVSILISLLWFIPLIRMLFSDFRHRSKDNEKRVTRPHLFAFSLFFISLAFSFYISHVNTESRLLPEVASIVLDPKAPELDELKRNVYVGMLAIDAPEGMDYMEIGAQVVLNNYSLFKQGMITQSAVDEKEIDNPAKHYDNKLALKWDFGKDGAAFQYACVRLDAPDCIEEALEKKEETLALMKKEANITLMQRYREILGLPHYQAHYYTPYDPWPNYGSQVQFSRIRLAQALFAFDEGNIDAGFELLGEEMAAAKRMLRENESLVGHLIAVNLLYPHYHTISALMDTPQMKPYLRDPRLLALLAPLTDGEQKALSRSFVIERNNSLYVVYMLGSYSSYISSERGKQEISARTSALSEAEKQAFLSRLKKSVRMVFFDRPGTVNMTYKAWEPILQRAGMSMEDIALLYAQNKLENLQKAINKTIKNNPWIPLNFVGYILTYVASPDFEPYLQRLYDVQSYILLVNTKHQILSQGLEPSQVEPFLESAGKAAQNPITGERFTWNATAGTLSTAWLAEKPPPGARKDGEKESMPSNTVFLKLNR